MKNTIPRLLFLAACLLLGGAASAERADRNKPMNVESDALRYDDLKQTNVFTGRVVMTKGTIVIRGARLDVRQDPEGYQYGVVTAEPGKRAFFRQKREGVDEFIEGEGETIEYDGKADVVKFIKRGELRRYKGDVLNDEVSGAIVVYDNVTEVFTVDGNPSAPGSGNMGGRVRAVLTPKGAASAPAAAGTPTPTLRPSTTLGGEKK